MHHQFILTVCPFQRKTAENISCAGGGEERREKSQQSTALIKVDDSPSHSLTLSCVECFYVRLSFVVPLFFRQFTDETETRPHFTLQYFQVQFAGRWWWCFRGPHAARTLSRAASEFLQLINSLLQFELIEMFNLKLSFMDSVLQMLADHHQRQFKRKICN